ncbi:MAG: 2-amino-4-hydroxy-6-hydroxymethyldihydropteridine diphosphokinase [Syntrophomonas sp.]|uniref:2-amino-4-hydroxy-6- hydroxymethyldihydropteridine diphosphokinase n=1 Tax=Syntrophomonas sp. TaxID=2053627 RepID=UPI002607974C|nr:2-amino-4-hydroxy-6-hydroxymethyldihydropteridine diphosphokinase [Syntrophomonas sp.]MDD2510448.1 2-amino-4-hydroxy-6-hydroxymethyldihydropteridine diphosphokinase [Syntrophomonas sp.]MDD3879745.1 2-amino-4-hydroxy-6-hydroxymethyldihydropteridine diphosphokinase [Syntrophomonas sp.]MDD4626704.1 2-amino-4-hydroxy-6-hydroxymethyldihydropteridine diphosphokinase [Syntrophomonas sp.]
MKNRVYIGLGSNCGFKQENLAVARNMITELEGTRIVKSSSLYLTAPWGRTEQEDFINQVIEIETALEPLVLLQSLQEIEIKMGRQRKEKWGPRIIDLDILLFGDEVLDFPELKVPHPLMRQRLFVLVPLREINAEIIFPDDGAKIKEVLIRVFAREGNSKIKRVEGSPTRNPGSGRIAGIYYEPDEKLSPED